MRIDQALALSATLEATSDSARLDIELLLCAVLDKPRSYLFTWPEKTLSAADITQLEGFVERRKQGEPVAHIVGHTGFWTLQLAVTPDTLIPRPDTERLVELALDKMPEQGGRVADLGTGSGAIALALASERPDCQLVGCDRVEDAVALAQRNQQLLRLSNVEFVQGSWFEPLTGRFDLIVSNPPYIDPADPHLSQGDVRFEPDSALTAGEQGMADIRHIAEQAPQYLQPGGWLMFEHGYDQGPASVALLQQLGYQAVATMQDYGNRDRVTLGCWQNQE